MDIIKELVEMSIEEYERFLAQVEQARQEQLKNKVSAAVINFRKAYNTLIETTRQTGYTCNVYGNDEISYLTFITWSSEDKEIKLYTFEGAENEFGEYSPNLEFYS